MESSCPSNLHSSACYHSISCSFIVCIHRAPFSTLLCFTLSWKEHIQFMPSTATRMLKIPSLLIQPWSLISLTATYTLYSSLLSVIFFFNLFYLSFQTQHYTRWSSGYLGNYWICWRTIMREEYIFLKMAQISMNRDIWNKKAMWKINAFRS